MDKVAIIGFVDHMKCFPSGLVTIVFVDGKYYSKWPMPGSELVPILDVQKEEDLVNPNYWKDTSGRLLDISRDEFAFAFSKEQIIIGTITEIIETVQKERAGEIFPKEMLDKLDLTIKETYEDPAIRCHLK